MVVGGCGVWDGVGWWGRGVGAAVEVVWVVVVVIKILGVVGGQSLQKFSCLCLSDYGAIFSFNLLLGEH